MLYNNLSFPYFSKVDIGKHKGVFIAEPVPNLENKIVGKASTVILELEFVKLLKESRRIVAVENSILVLVVPITLPAN